MPVRRRANLPHPHRNHFIRGCRGPTILAAFAAAAASPQCAAAYPTRSFECGSTIMGAAYPTQRGKGRKEGRTCQSGAERTSLIRIATILLTAFAAAAYSAATYQYSAESRICPTGLAPVWDEPTHPPIHSNRETSRADACCDPSGKRGSQSCPPAGAVYEEIPMK